MSDVINTLSSQTGIGPELISKGLGALLKILQDQLPADLFAKIGSLLPNAGELISAATAAGQGSGGLMKAVTDLAGKIFGGQGGAATDLLAQLSHLGFSAEQLQAFIPKILEFFKSNLPADVLDQVQGLLPSLPDAPATPEA